MISFVYTNALLIIFKANQNRNELVVLLEAVEGDQCEEDEEGLEAHREVDFEEEDVEGLAVVVVGSHEAAAAMVFEEVLVVEEVLLASAEDEVVLVDLVEVEDNCIFLISINGYPISISLEVHTSKLSVQAIRPTRLTRVCSDAF